ncbi:MAG: PD-(D/E)XK nuclease family protein, partial [Paludibacteraceae bacterium]|nr:PD-(D/E)XK nuclease family protein [Paludibacteraceae bacterium]
MNAFLVDVTRHIILTYGIDRLAHITIVVPTRRAMLVVKDCIKQYMRQNGLQGPVQLPQMTSLAQLFDELSPKYKVDEIQLVCTLYRVYCQTISYQAEGSKPQTQISLADFYGWGRQLVQDFSNIDKAFPLVTPQDFLRNTAYAHELENLDIDADVRERLLQLISLREENHVLAQSKRQEFERLWQNLPLLYERFGQQLGIYGYEGARMKAVIEHWNDDRIQRRIEKRHFVFAGFNYLVPAEKKLMHLLKEQNQASFYWDYPDHFTANTKAFRWIIKNAAEFGNALPVQPWQTKPVEIICTASQHAQAQYVYPWLIANHHPGERTAVVICDESALEQVIYALPPADQMVNISKGFPLRHTDAYAKILTLLNGKTPVSIDDLMPDIKQLDPEEMVQLTWHEMLDYEARFQIRLALTRFKKMQQEGLIPPLEDLRTQRLILRRYLESISFPFHGEPLAEIQVTGVLETRAMDFDNVLLLNVEEGVVPHVGADLSYLPYYLRKAYGLQTHEESTDVYAYNFFRLIARANRVTMMYTGSESKYNKKTMSRFLRQILASDNFSVTKTILSEPNTLSAPLIPISQLRNDKMVNDQMVNAFSPSALNTFRSCRVQFYLSYILGIQEPEEQTVLLQRNEIGTLVHKAIQELYTRYPDPRNVPEPLPFDQINNLQIGNAHPLELSAIKAFITRIVRSDKELANKSALQILEMETKYYAPVEVEGYGSVRVGGRIDRVDQVGEQVRIVDYKTGTHKSDDDFQTNIYREVYQLALNQK